LQRLWIPALLALCATACKRPTEGASPDAGAALEVRVSCDKIRTLGVCSEFGAAELERRGDYALENECERLRGTWSRGACPNWSLLGVCAMATERRGYYPGGGTSFDAESAKKDCAQLAGTWAAQR
jgi:hypothetical protein